MVRIVIWLIFLGGFAAGYFLIHRESKPVTLIPVPVDVEAERKATVNKHEQISLPNQESMIQEAVALASFVQHDVPFTPQAPFGDWSDQRFQDGCEEASMIMAKHWLSGDNLNAHIATQEILDVSKWEAVRYGTYRDTSAADTSNTLLEYYGIPSELFFTLDVVAAKQILANGAVLLIPSDGSILDNPYYSSPPVHHMLVVVGYDDGSGEFITNDPGTKRGKAFRYPYNTILNAAKDYPTGDHIKTTNRDLAAIAIYPQ